MFSLFKDCFGDESCRGKSGDFTYLSTPNVNINSLGKIGLLET